MLQLIEDIINNRIRKQAKISFYPALFLFEHLNCTDWIRFCYVLSLTEI